MKGYKELRKISRAFQDYGIVLTGKRKYDRFDRDLKMDKVFVMGLIFELEFQLKKNLSDDKADGVQAPAQVIELLMN